MRKVPSFHPLYLDNLDKYKAHKPFKNRNFPHHYSFTYSKKQYEIPMTSFTLFLKKGKLLVSKSMEKPSWNMTFDT